MIHAERGAVSNLLGRTNRDHSGLLSKLHLTVGGSRMRPCLEDFIDLICYEFRFDLLPGAQETLEAGRERWRRRQIGALVRDAPEEAVRVLCDLDIALPASRWTGITEYCRIAAQVVPEALTWPYELLDTRLCSCPAAIQQAVPSGSDDRIGRRVVPPGVGTCLFRRPQSPRRACVRGSHSCSWRAALSQVVSSSDATRPG